MKLTTIVIALYLTGILVFLHQANWESEWWANGYYIWDKVKDLLLFVSIFFLVAKHNRIKLWPIIIYSGIRVAWEIVSLTWHIDINTKPAVSTLLVCLGITYAWIFLKELPKWRNSK